MQQKVLFNKKLIIEPIGFLKKIIIKFNNKELPKRIKKIKGYINSKSLKLYYFSKPINKKPILIYGTKQKMNFISPSILNEFNFVVKLNFELDKNNYIFRKDFIYSNIDDLYDRITNLYKLVKNKIKVKYQIKGKEEVFNFNEKLFNLILTDLELNYNEYEEITDKIIVASILKFLQDKV